MTRVAVITFLHNDNYGSILQAYAMRQVLTALGHDVVFLDYAPDKTEKVRNLLFSGNSPRLILEGLRKRSATSRMHGGFDDFRRRYVTCIDAPCRNAVELRRMAQSNADVALCGSDQIWSPVWLNPVYFLHFTDLPKVAYAPSLGVQEMPSPRKARYIAALVKDFSALSVREKEGAELLRRMTGQTPPVLPDPVLLLSREEWQSLAADSTQPLPSAPYLLCYFIGDNPDYWRTVRETAKREGLRVCVIPRTEGAWNAGYALEEDVPPQRWLSLISGAARVVTDSFHGACFSALMNRPCTILRRYREDDPERKNSRIDQLLRTLQVTDLDAPDWSRINASLASCAETGRTWLREAIDKAAKPTAR